MRGEQDADTTKNERHKRREPRAVERRRKTPHLVEHSQIYPKMRVTLYRSIQQRPACVRHIDENDADRCYCTAHRRVRARGNRTRNQGRDGMEEKAYVPKRPQQSPHHGKMRHNGLTRMDDARNRDDTYLRSHNE